MHNCTIVLGKIEPIASEKPFRPSTHAISTSFTPLFARSVNTSSQNFDPSFSVTYDPNTSFLTSSSDYNAFFIIGDNIPFFDLLHLCFLGYFVKAYMDVAERLAKLSHAEKWQVGAIIVKEDKIILIGYNGMPSGFDNRYEDKIIEKDNKVVLKTKPEVLHAEANAITKLVCSVESGFGASIFVTHAPRMDCAKLIYQSGIKNCVL